METLKEAYCRKFGCAPEQFEREAFMACLHPFARLFARLAGHRAERFNLDRAVIAYCGTLRSKADLRRELGEYLGMPENQKFARAFLRVRISGGRLLQLASRCWDQE